MNREWDERLVRMLNRGEREHLFSGLAGREPSERIRRQLDDPDAWEIDEDLGVYELRRAALDATRPQEPEGEDKPQGGAYE